jgi:tetratricopeptide (TPR) repeat protein
MPFLQHPVIGDQLRFSRSDHTIPIPRPAFDEALGVENACSSCHQDLSVEELQEQTEEWYGTLKPHKDIIVGLLRADEMSDRKSAASLLLQSEGNHPIAKVTAVDRFFERFLRPNMRRLEKEVVAALQELAVNEYMDVRAIALATLHAARGEDPSTRRFLAEQLEGMGALDEDLRRRWVVALVLFGERYHKGGDLHNAIVVYKKGLEILPNDAGALLYLARAHNETGDYANAIEFFQRTLESVDASESNRWLVDPNVGLLLVSLGLALENHGQAAAAAEAYRRAIARDPGEVMAYFRLGNYYMETSEYAEATDLYRKALALKPDFAQAYYHLGLGYAGMNQIEPAVAAVERSLELEPGNTEAQQTRRRLRDALQSSTMN